MPGSRGELAPIQQLTDDPYRHRRNSDPLNCWCRDSTFHELFAGGIGIDQVASGGRLRRLHDS